MKRKFLIIVTIILFSFFIEFIIPKSGFFYTTTNISKVNTAENLIYKNDSSYTNETLTTKTRKIGGQSLPNQLPTRKSNINFILNTTDYNTNKPLIQINENDYVKDIEEIIKNKNVVTHCSNYIKSEIVDKNIKKKLSNLGEETDTFFILNTEDNQLITENEKNALNKIFGITQGNISLSYFIEKLRDSKNLNLFNKLGLAHYFEQLSNPSDAQKIINNYALEYQIEINNKFIEKANTERIKVGLSPAISAFDTKFKNIQIDKFIQEIVNERAEEMANYGNLRYLGKKEGKHKRPDGRNWYTIYSDKEIDIVGNTRDNKRYNMAGENAMQGNWNDAYLLSAPDEIINDTFSSWMDSPSHKSLIMFDVPHPIFAFSYRQGLKDYLGDKNKPTIAILHVTNWFNPLENPTSKESYENWRLSPENKNNILASEEYYNFLQDDSKN